MSVSSFRVSGRIFLAMLIAGATIHVRSVTGRQRDIAELRVRASRLAAETPTADEPVEDLSRMRDAVEAEVRALPTDGSNSLLGHLASAMRDVGIDAPSIRSGISRSTRGIGTSTIDVEFTCTLEVMIELLQRLAGTDRAWSVSRLKIDRIAGRADAAVAVSLQLCAYSRATEPPR